ncbi:MAG: hypothetical protein H7Y37_14865 [Anaerolineae bacterium]|nr:hypothetical protein [Gloeobacterales cyanobacterium ES-bin-313]
MSQRLPATALDLAISCGRQNASSMHIQMIVAVEGQVEIERLKKAVFLTIEAEPVLGCRFVDHPIRPYWEPQPTFSQKAFLERYCCVVETTNPEAEVDVFLPVPLDPSTDPLIQVRVFRQLGNPQEIIVFKLCHLVGDAGGLLGYCKFLIGIYAKLALDPSYKPDTNTRSRGFDQISKQYSNKEKLQIVRSTIAALKRRDSVTNRCGFPNPSAPAEQRMYLRKEIPVEQVQALKSYGRKQGATLNLVLLTAYFRSICKNIPLLGTGAVPLMSTVDLRRYVPDAERDQIPLCNLSGVTTMYINQEAPDKKPFTETLALVKEQMKERKADYLGLLMVPLVLGLYGVLPYKLSQRIAKNDFAKAKKNQTTAPVLTNAGEIPAEDYEFGDVKLVNIYGAASVMYSPVFATSVTEFRKTVTLCTGFCQTLIPRATVEAIFNGVAEELAGLAEGHLNASKNAKKVVEA